MSQMIKVPKIDEMVSTLSTHLQRGFTIFRWCKASGSPSFCPGRPLVGSIVGDTSVLGSDP